MAYRHRRGRFVLPWAALWVEATLGTLILAAALICGCQKNVNAPPAPLPPGATSQFDATSYRVIEDTHAAIKSLRDSAASGKIVLTPAQKSQMNQVIADQNTAQELWKAYHAAPTGDTTALSAAIQGLVKDIATVTQMVSGGGVK